MCKCKFQALFFFLQKKTPFKTLNKKTLSLLFWTLKREKSFEKKEEEEDDASSGDESGRRSGEKENAAAAADDDDSDADDSDDDFGGDFRSRATSERQSVLEKGRLFNDFQSKRVSSVFFFFFFFIVCAKLCVFENDARDDARDNNSEGRKTGERKSAGVVDAESFE